MSDRPSILAVSPRIAPPPGNLAADGMVHVDAPGSGWLPTWKLTPASQGWDSDWFSTRCHLMDLDRLRGLLPLLPAVGARANAMRHLVNALLAPAYASRIWTDPAPVSGWKRPFA